MAQPVVLSQTGAGVSAWKNADFRANPFVLQFNCSVSGTVAYSIETTNSDLLGGATAIVAATTIAAATAAAALTLTGPCRFWRLNQASGSGTTTVEAIQAGF